MLGAGLKTVVLLQHMRALGDDDAVPLRCRDRIARRPFGSTPRPLRSIRMQPAVERARQMDVIEIYDYYFCTDPYRKFDARCEYGVCENNIVYRRLKSAVEECKQRDLNRTRFECSGPDSFETEPDRRAFTKDLSDVLEYMLYNVTGDTGLPAHYSCCITFFNRKSEKTTKNDTYVEYDHVCNAIPIMIGSKLENKIVHRLADMLDIPVGEVFDAEYLHNVYAGSFLVNGTFYYSVFRESNNNKICHNSKSKYRGNETVAYFYDNTCNRGVKLFTDQLGMLRVNDRDGNEVSDVTSEVMLQLYKECTQNWRHYTLDMRLITGFFSSVKNQSLCGIDDFKNKIYTNYSIGLNAFLNKLPSSAMSNPVWNSSLMIGKVNFGISQRLIYPKSKSEVKKQNEQKLKMCSGGMSTGYLVDTQRRRNARKTTNSAPRIGATTNDPDGKRKREVRAEKDPRTRKKAKATNGTSMNDTVVRPQHTILGSKDVKMIGLMEKLEKGENNGPSTFNQVSVSYLPLIRILSSTVQKLQVEHVHAESSKTVPRDAYGFICMKYMGNISTAGKNMLFTDRVQVSYGHVHRIVGAVETGLWKLARRSEKALTSNDRLVVVRRSNGSQENTVEANDYDEQQWLYVVINNAVTMWSVPRERVLELMLYVKTKCHRYAWTKIVGEYLCVYYYEGVPLLRYEREEMMFDKLNVWLRETTALDVLDGTTCLYFSRDELEMLTAFESRIPVTDKHRLIETTNNMIDKWFMTTGEDGSYEFVDHSSLLAKQIDQYTDYTPPAKRCVSVNARKSACINVYYQRAADLIRGFNIFTDPDGYERATAKRAASEHGVPEWVTLRDFIRARAELQNCPEPQDGTDRSVANFYLLRTVFADVGGFNVEDANVLDASVDLCLSYSYSFSLTFVDRTKAGLDIIVPPPRNAAAVCCWDSDGNPSAVLFAVCTIRRKGVETCTDTDVGDMLRDSRDVRFVNNKQNGGNSFGKPTSKDVISFPPFRKLSVIQSEDGDFHVYFVRNDAVLLRSLRALRQKSGSIADAVPNKSNAVRLAEGAYAFICKPEANPYDAFKSLQTKITSFQVNSEERVITIDARVHGTSDKYDGLKIVNSFGQKGLALIKDLKPYFGERNGRTSHDVHLVMNNCSFISRQTVGQYLQMRKNMYAVTTSTAGEETSVGYSAVFFTETEPVTKSCLVRFDEMMRSVIITLGLSVFQNLKNSLDNVYNPLGLLYPPQTRQILSLYRCVGVSYSFQGDKCTPFATRDDVDLLTRIYDAYSKTPKPNNSNGSKALLEFLKIVHDRDRFKRLSDIGAIQEIRPRSTDGGRRENAIGKRHEYVVRLQGQWLDGFKQFDRREITENDLPPDYELRTYHSKRGTFCTFYIYGDPTDLLVENS